MSLTLSNQKILAHMSGRKNKINFKDTKDLYFNHINPWKKCSDLMLLSKHLAELFLRSLRSKDSLTMKKEILNKIKTAPNLKNVIKPYVGQTLIKKFSSKF